jgi:hypothetical protein
LSSADGDWDFDLNCDWNVMDVTAKKFNQFCEFHIFIIGETTIVLLDLFADPHSNRIEIKCYLKDFKESLTDGLPT